eukprot:SAG31_NODE_3987_length_3683_cov_4.328962_5_plen_77_part_00
MAICALATGLQVPCCSASPLRWAHGCCDAKSGQPKACDVIVWRRFSFGSVSALTFCHCMQATSADCSALRHKVQRQ